MKQIRELTIKQAVGRAVEWRIIAALIDFLVLLALTGHVIIAIGITGISSVIKTVINALWIKYRGHG